MALEVNGKSIETDENGNLVNPNDWDEDVARALAAADDTMGELTQEHWDVINYLRETYFQENEQPMERVINKPARGIGKTTVEQIEAHARKIQRIEAVSQKCRSF